jgi:hypothetical protein
MIRAVQGCGIAACGKHFPGHGDTAVDSHIRLPVVDKTLRRLKKCELAPFQRAVQEQVKMIMLGHLKVPALDSSGVPVSLSKKAVAFIRQRMGYDGILITDAMNMGGIGRLSEEKASFLSLAAGVDILLHPTVPEQIVSYLTTKKTVFDASRLSRFRTGLQRRETGAIPEFERHGRLSDYLTEKAIRPSADFRVRGGLFLVILNDDDSSSKGLILSRGLKKAVPAVKTEIIRKGADIRALKPPEGSFVAVAVFSETKAWKGGASDWLYRQIAQIKNRADLLVSFGSPYLFDAMGKATGKGVKMFAYGDSEPAQRAVAKLIGKKAAGLLKGR